MDDGTAALAGTETTQQQPPPPAAAPQPASTPGTAMIQPEQQPAYQAPAMTTEPVRRHGLLGVLDAVTDMLAGRDQTKVSYDENGRQTQKIPLTRGQQYARIGLEALSGAARGAAAPPGPAHTMQGFAGGTMGGINDVKQGDQEAEENAQKQFDEQQKAKINALNYQLGIRAIAKNDLELKNMNVKAAQDAVTFSNQQLDREKQLGSYDLGTAKDAGEIADIVSKLPNWEQELYRHEGLQPHPVYDEEGNRTGIRIFLRKPDIDNQPAPQGTKVPKWVPGQKPGEEPHTEFFTPLGPNGEPPTNADIDKYNRAYLTDVQAYQKQKAEDDQKAALAAEERANASKAPSEIRKNKAQADEAEAAAAKNRAEAAKAKSQTADDSLVDAMGTGHITAERMAYLLARNPDLVQQVVAKYPDFDTSKAEAYPNVYKEFTSTKKGSAGAALNSGATALIHLNELRKMNTVKSHIPGTADYNAYMNKVHTLAPELANFYGDATIPAIQKLEETLAATLPGNRDAAIRTQAKSMGDKFDQYEQTWQNAAPSKAYEAPMPGVSDEANAARAELDHDFRARQVQKTSAGSGPDSAYAGAVQPGEHVSSGPNGTVVFRGNKWRNPTTGAAVQ